MARARRRRLLTAAASVLGHGAVLFVLVSAQPEPAPTAEPEPMTVALVAPPPPEPPPSPSPKLEPSAALAPERPAPPKPKPRPHIARRAPPSPDVAPVAAGEGPPGDGIAEVSEAEVAGAATAGVGSGTGAGCDMTRWLQGRLRQDRRVQAAVADVQRGRAIRVWNGDWVRHGGQEGAGLATVREAIIWEVAFAPAACRAEPVRGLVMISLNDGPRPARLVMGAGQWRWSDLLFARRR